MLLIVCICCSNCCVQIYLSGGLYLCSFQQWEKGKTMGAISINNFHNIQLLRGLNQKLITPLIFFVCILFLLVAPFFRQFYLFFLVSFSPFVHYDM